MRLFHFALPLLALSACSETARKAALYNPVDDDTAPPATFVNQRPQTDEPLENPALNDTPLAQGAPLARNHALPTQKQGILRPNMAFPASGMNVLSMDSEILMRELSSSRHMTFEFRRSLKLAEIVEIRMEYQAVQSLAEKQELELEGYLTFVMKTRDGLFHVRRLLNSGPIVYSADGEQDLMSARFELRKGVSLEVSMSRSASRTLQEALVNPWEGLLILRDHESMPETVAELQGFVSSL